MIAIQFLSTVNPFIGTPSHLFSIPLFQPLHISVSFASIPQQTIEDINILFEPVDRSPQILPEIKITNFGAIITYENSLYSIEGLYNIILNLTTLHSITSTAITIDVLGKDYFQTLRNKEYQMTRSLIKCILTPCELYFYV